MNGSQKTNDVSWISFIYDKVMCVKLLCFEKTCRAVCLCYGSGSKDCTLNERNYTYQRCLQEPYGAESHIIVCF